MAATDQTYRNQRVLDIVFAASCVLMLVSIIMMFSQDYFQEWKHDQNTFNDADEQMNVYEGLAVVPPEKDIEDIEAKIDEKRKQVEDDRKDDLKRVRDEIKKWSPLKVKREFAYNDVKATYDSKVSLYNIAVDEYYTSRADSLSKEVATLREQLNQKQREFEEAKANLEAAQQELARIQEPVSDLVTKLKKMNADADAYLRAAARRRAGLGYWFRELPVIDAFASPTKIKQIVLNDLTIDYGTFKRVPRWDRCTTCHLGIDRDGFTKERLRQLAEVPDDARDRLESVKKALQRRKKILQASGEKIDLDPDDLRLRPVKLLTTTGGEEDPKFINEFCVHPRLDLFVDAKSPHAAEKFGCTTCHAGQGSSTDFVLASHTPNNAADKKRWVKQRDWESVHFWDYPMLPKRFIESSCVKCHYDMTDLIRDGNREEAPKLLHGYNLIRENGCFGCHEISGYKGGRRIGPDLRTEPSPALEAMTPGERRQFLAEASDPPGTMRKVGPSLRRLAEKTNEQWVRTWIDSPRTFRPDTRMPHFYHLSNNDAKALEGTGQEDFPAVEVRSIAHFLMHNSHDYLGNVKKLHENDKTDRALAQSDQERFNQLTSLPELDVKQKKELEPIVLRIRMREALAALPDRTGLKKGADDKRGGNLFRVRGCLACHTHEATNEGSDGLPALKSDQHFGPNLSRIAAKLGDRPGDDKAWNWLVQWILDPKVHHPRTFMPVTHLTEPEAADVAAWLLKNSQPNYEGKDLPAASTEALKKLTRVYFEKATSIDDANALLDKPAGDEVHQAVLKKLKGLKGESDEKVLADGIDDNALLLYIGHKAVGQYGCYGCHDIPGYETAKPIGTALNDWGKKDPERLAFEDIDAFVKAHYEGVEKGESDNYDAFFYDALTHRQREGFLNQKLRQPRSYDYDRQRTWDERLRMPQFRFSRTPVPGKEAKVSAKEAASSEKAEAEAREAVMTFVLGLVAEPVETKYVYQPAGDRLAEVKGRQVLDKYNCASCHLVQPGRFELKSGDPKVLAALKESYGNEERSRFADDHRFLNSSVWVGPPRTNPDRVVLHGTSETDEDEEGQPALLIQLTEAVRLDGLRGLSGDLPAAAVVSLRKKDLDRALISRVDTMGGKFAADLAAYLTQIDPKVPAADKDRKRDRRLVPPVLIREGEKVQPGWLYQFLRNPERIRPMVQLRMPRFNMSDSEAMALVNYFAALDRATNRDLDLHYPYITVAQRDENYWKAKNDEYVQRLSDAKVNERLEGTFKDDWAKSLAALEDTNPRKKKPDKPDQEMAWKRAWLTDLGAYQADGYRMVASYGTCLACHQIGSNLPTDRENSGPPLMLTSERLRPEWTAQWIGNPLRFSYASREPLMPQPFSRSKDTQKDAKISPFFEGTTFQHVEAARDVLMNLPRLADMPANRNYLPPRDLGGKK